MDYWRKVKTWFAANKDGLFTAVFIFLTGLGAFGLGRLSMVWPPKEPITISNAPAAAEKTGESSSTLQTATAAKIVPIEGKYVASKSSTYYHFPWCPGAQRIKESNKIWFETKQDAEAKGYKPAGNCPGL